MEEVKRITIESAKIEMREHNIVMRYIVFISIWIILAIALIIFNIGGSFRDETSDLTLIIWLVIFAVPLAYWEYSIIKYRNKIGENIFKSLRKKKDDK